MPSNATTGDVLDVHCQGTDVTSKITLTPRQSVLSWVLTAASVALSVMAAFLPWYAEGAFYTLPLIVVAFAVFVAILDMLFLPFMKRTIARAEAAGHSRVACAGYLGSTLILFGLFAWLPIRFFRCFAEAEPRFTAEFYLKAVACACASDIPLFLLHRALHRQMWKLHVLHHLCVDPSLAAAFFVEPIDAVCELLVPGCTVMFFTVGVMGDPWVHLGATAIMTAWYIISHDPQVKLQHYYHHAHCDSCYNGYVPITMPHDPKDRVRSEVFKIRQQERDAAKKQ